MQQKTGLLVVSLDLAISHTSSVRGTRLGMRRE
jgi:hypothetical protein